MEWKLLTACCMLLFQCFTFRKQVNGYWFYNVGTIGTYSEFAYQIEGEDGSKTIRLIQGGKEV